MEIDVLTIFPKMFNAVLGESILKRAQAKKLIEIRIHDLRDYTRDKHRKIDDKPYGGGSGMVFRIEPIYNALKKINPRSAHVVLLTPKGKTLSQKSALRLSKRKHLMLIAGHYEGVDERVKRYIDEEISVGDYVLTGGELPAMVLIDAVARLIPGVLGDESSAGADSFYDGFLEHPHYTRPAEFMGLKVPQVLLSGDHEAIAKWRKEQSRIITKKRRPDILRKES